MAYDSSYMFIYSDPIVRPLLPWCQLTARALNLPLRWYLHSSSWSRLVFVSICSDFLLLRMAEWLIKKEEGRGPDHLQYNTRVHGGETVGLLQQKWSSRTGDFIAFRTVKSLRITGRCQKNSSSALQLRSFPFRSFFLFRKYPAIIIN